MKVPFEDASSAKFLIRVTQLIFASLAVSGVIMLVGSAFVGVDVGDGSSSLPPVWLGLPSVSGVLIMFLFGSQRRKKAEAIAGRSISSSQMREIYYHTAAGEIVPEDDLISAQEYLARDLMSRHRVFVSFFIVSGFLVALFVGALLLGAWLPLAVVAFVLLFLGFCCGMWARVKSAAGSDRVNALFDSH